jgi:hypothetical protein
VEVLNIIATELPTLLWLLKIFFGYICYEKSFYKLLSTTKPGACVRLTFAQQELTFGSIA